MSQKLTTNQIREKYLNYFKSKGHTIIPSAPLVPENDPSTLFTGSGMQPIVPYLLGEKHPQGIRLTDAQKCFRSQDIEEVGDNRHTTFFEMLGNWSLGDYFKEEQIELIFNFLVKEVGIDANKLYVTVYRGNNDIGIGRDDIAVAKWKEVFKSVGIDAKDVDMPEVNGMGDGRIFYYPDKKNWWSRVGEPSKMPIGEPGGPDSEMFYDFGEHRNLHENSPWKNEPCHVNCDCGRFTEIGNSVFMEFIRTQDGFKPLPKKNVDFGGGLERIASALNDDPDMFKTDIFDYLRTTIENKANKKYGQDETETFAFRVIMDHLRASTFLIADGVPPSNKEQGYFVRRLIRRAIRFAYKLGVETNFTKDIANAVIDTFKGHYTYLNEKREYIVTELENEENKFRKTLELGLKEFEKKAHADISGYDAFDLYQTFGFPIEITLELAQEKGIKVDEEGFKEELKKHQDLSRTASAGMFKGGLADASEETTRLHTAAHLMLAGLRKILGEHVTQRGSNITAERLRFDFTQPDKMTPEQIKAVEDFVNTAIEKKLDVTMEELVLDEAKAKGAVGVFESKYGEKVKVYKIGEGDSVVSYEICGGPHVNNTGELGKFIIQKEESSSAGVRRIKAVLE